MQYFFKRNLLYLLTLSGCLFLNACRSAQSIWAEEQKQRDTQRANERNEKLFKEFLGQTWKLEELQQVDYDMVNVSDVFKGQSYTITFKNDGTVSGVSFCNSYTAKYDRQKSTDKLTTIVFSDIEMTKNECSKPSDEASFLNVLQTTRSYSMYPDALILHCEGTFNVLKFVRDTL